MESFDYGAYTAVLRRKAKTISTARRGQETKRSRLAGQDYRWPDYRRSQRKWIADYRIAALD